MKLLGNTRFFFNEKSSFFLNLGGGQSLINLHMHVSNLVNIAIRTYYICTEESEYILRRKVMHLIISYCHAWRLAHKDAEEKSKLCRQYSAL